MRRNCPYAKKRHSRGRRSLEGRESIANWWKGLSHQEEGKDSKNEMQQTEKPHFC